MLQGSVLCYEVPHFVTWLYIVLQINGTIRGWRRMIVWHPGRPLRIHLYARRLRGNAKCMRDMPQTLHQQIIIIIINDNH